MSTKNPPDPEADLEQDSRFPSGPWKGYFLQPLLPGKHWMELSLTFRKGILKGEGCDWVGRFDFRGRYDVETGKCWWTKQYVRRHSIAYQGYNEGRGIWGIWEWPKSPTWRGGFHIWPVGMGEADGSNLMEAVEPPVTIDVETVEISESLV